MIVTIDGPAGTGKTTIARLLAEKLQFRYFDTGALYRAVTYQMGQEGIELQNEDQLKTLLEQFQFDIRDVGKERRYFIQGNDITDFIRTPQINQKVSEVASHSTVRKALIGVQREFGKGKNVVFEGRDMGTVVFPLAEVKIFLTARPAVRAERRYLEFQKKEVAGTQAEVMQELLERDHVDSTREISPLKQAEDAHIIDTSDLNIDAVINLIVTIVKSPQTASRPKTTEL